MTSHCRDLWPELVVVNFTVTEKRPKDGCKIRVGIAKGKYFSGKVEKYFNRPIFQLKQQLLPVAIDPANVVMIVLQKVS